MTESKMHFLALLTVLFFTNISANKPPFCEICDCELVYDFYNIICTGDIKRLLYKSSYWYSKKGDFFPYRELTVENTPLYQIDTDFPESDIIRLTLRNTSVDYITETVFGNLENLEELVLSHNMIETFHPKAFAGYDSVRGYNNLPIKNLFLDHNRIKNLRPELFKFSPYIEVLSLAHNPMQTIGARTKKALNQLLFLRKLDLSYTQLETLSETFLAPSSKLRHLNLSGNKFVQIPEVLSLYHLYTLDFNHNPVIYLNNNREMAHIRSVHMNHMPFLEEIRKMNFVNLEELYLSNNTQLNHIDKDAFLFINEHKRNWTALKKLHLRGNNLTTISMELLDWDILEEVDLGDNPWDCSCTNRWIINDLLPNVLLKIDPEKAKELRCGLPSQFESVTLLEIYEGKMWCWAVFNTLLYVTVEFQDKVQHHWMSYLSTTFVVVLTVFIFLKRHRKMPS